jgi:hypothetical protein
MRNFQNPSQSSYQTLSASDSFIHRLPAKCRKLYKISSVIILIILGGLLINEKVHRYYELKDSIRIDRALKATSAGRWYYDVDKDILVWDKGMFKLFNKTKDTWEPTMKGFTDCLYTSDRKSIVKLMEDVIQNRSVYYSRYRVVGDGGEVRNIVAFGSVSEDGKEFAGVCLPRLDDLPDITMGADTLNSEVYLYNMPANLEASLNIHN